MKAFKVVSQVFCSASCAVAFATASYGGTLTVEFGSAMQVIEGGVTNSYAKGATFTPTAIPCVYKMRMGGLSAGGRTFAIAGNDEIHGSSYYRYPQYNDDGWVRVALNPYPASDTTVKLTAYKVSKVYYVDEKNGKDSYDGTADAEHIDDALGKGPKATLQAAHDAATAGNTTSGFPVVYVAPGFYSNGVTVATYTSSKGDSSSNRRLVTSKNIAFIATEGAEKTFIVGAPDSSGAGGFGTDAVGGVYMFTSSLPAYLQGFTITGCYSPATQDGIGHYGTAFCSATHRVACLDCIISNNYAKSYYPAASYGVYQRTKFIENKSPSYLNYYGTFISCVFAGNRVTSGNGTTVAHSLHTQTHSYFCTYDLGDADYPDGRSRLNTTSGCNINSSLIYKMPNPETDQQTYWHACQIVDNPIFADAAARDYRLGALSPALDANSYETGLNAGMRSVMTGDIDGRMPVLRDGKMRLGAVWNDPPLPVTEIIGVGGGVAVTGASAGTNVVSSADQITVTASAARPFLGFEVNGEMVAAPGGTYSLTPSVEAGAVNSVKAIYSSDWYVDCVNGDDANPGTAALPKQTIRSATTNAVSGDVIHVAPGTYGALEEFQVTSATATCGFRVILPEGVSLIGTQGAEKTFIVGAEATGNNIDNETYKTGANGVRCVYAHNGALIRGFTLTGGHGVGTSSGSNAGAALYSPNALGVTIEDCIVSNNVAYNSTINQAVVKRCRVLNNVGLRLNSKNQSDQTGAAGTACSWHNCIIAGNIGNAVVRTPTCVESCTFGTNQQYPSGSAQVIYNPSGPVLNSLFLYASDRWNGTIYATNCIFASAEKSGLSAANCSNCLFNTAVSVTNYKPAYGSLAIDAGSNEIARVDIANETDILGTPRALNGRIDIGAVEYDWRLKFAQEVGKRMTIEYASPSVVTNAAGGLLIPSGEVVGRVSAGGKYSFTLDIPSGTVEAFVGGVSAGTLASVGEQTITVDIPDAETEFRLVFTPDAEAPEATVLKKIASNRGFVLIYW